jgi:phosphotransferase system enzyme I (PtsP)
MSPHRTGLSGARALMAQLRRQMAETDPAPERLQSLVRLIAASMVTDVCSIYARGEDGALVLIATEGLKAEAVRQTRLRLGEGLVGLVAERLEPVSVADAPRHPRFSYRPETGEEPYRSFLGVPILRQAQCLGVLVVQNKVSKVYEEEDAEALETVAMLLAEILAADAARLVGVSLTETRPKVVRGDVVNSGLALGVAVLHDPVVPAARFFAADADAERARLRGALTRLRGWIGDVLGGGAVLQAGASRDVFESYALLAADPSWERRLQEAVDAGLSAEAAIDRVRGQHRARLGAARDPYLREKLHDLEDLENRLLRFLVEDPDASGPAPLPPGAILVARSVGPAELLDYARAGIAGVVLETGGSGGHVAIIARALDVPALVCGEGSTATIQAGDLLALEAVVGGAIPPQVLVRPNAEQRAGLEARMASANTAREAVRRNRAAPAKSKDGKLVSVELNAGLAFEVDQLQTSGAEAIGLFRTEFQFLMSAELPRLSAQQAFYRDVMERAGKLRVVFRTLDLGGDKFAAALRLPKEANPALGLRSLRLALAHPGLFRTQVRALVRAAAGRELSLLIPFVATGDEFAQARALIDREMAFSRSHGHGVPLALRVGAMIEVPSAVFALPEIARQADFLSVGTNDLVQHLFAADRDNAEVSRRYDLLHPAALRVMAQIEREAARARTPVSVCGEAAGNPAEALALLALGFRRLSVAGPRVAAVKALVRDCDIAKLRRKFLHEIDRPDGQPREILLKMLGHTA